MRSEKEIREKAKEMKEAFEEGGNQQYAGNLEALLWVLEKDPYLD